MKKVLFPLLMLVLAMSACQQNNQTVSTTPANDSIKTESKDILHRLPTLHVEDTITSGKNVYAIQIHRQACDSLGIVIDDMGYRYVDNLLKVSVKKNGSTLFSRTFKKANFLHLLDTEFAKHSILDGCRFLQVHEGMVSFSLAVSYPDSDMSRPLMLNIGPDGSYTITKIDDLEDEYGQVSSDGV